MKNNYQKFYNLHLQENPFFLGNVWNVQSARAMENSNCKALGTSSAAIANSLGYEDGENLPFEEYFYIIERIIKNTSLPLSVDLESGFGKSIEQVCENIIKLSDIGVVGINLEDSIVVNGERYMVEKENFLEKLRAIKKLNLDVFINVRIDTFLIKIPNLIEITKERILFYEKYCDGFFLPCIVKDSDINLISNFTKLPLNVMSMPDLPNFVDLKKNGVKRISSGNFLNDYIYKTLERKQREILEIQNFSTLFL